MSGWGSGCGAVANVQGFGAISQFWPEKLHARHSVANGTQELNRRQTVRPRTRTRTWQMVCSGLRKDLRVSEGDRTQASAQ
jgi:hypothetical protein